MKNNLIPNNVIVAPASGVGGALSVIRVSGKDSVKLVNKIFRSKTGESTLIDLKGFSLVFGI